MEGGHGRTAPHAVAEDGQTIVVKFDRAALSGGDVRVAVEEESGEALATNEASSLQDVLDPDDDGDAAEYWVVEDAQGTQVLVSVPHFSAKRITIEGAGGGDGGLAGLGAGGVVLGVLGAAVLVAAVGRRRPN